MAAETRPTNHQQVDQPETNISTFVFLDFESTSLLERKCRITELSLLAVNRVDMEEPGTFPRVSNKLTLCLDPKVPISMASSNITGLFNDSLEYQKALTAETVTLINSFLNHLSKPICLLAHNGNRFDFPLLMAELKRIHKCLDASLLCADTLEAFRSLDGLPARFDPLANQNSGTKSPNSPMKNNVTPSKSVASNAQSPLKRKGAADGDTVNKQSPKVSRQDTDNKKMSDERKLSAEKAKKKLEFEELRTDVKKQNENSAENVQEDTKRKDEETKDEVIEEFSASLEDADYLLALDTVEKDLREDKLAFVQGTKESESKCGESEQDNTEMKVLPSSVANSTAATATSVVEPSCVENGTGYILRSNVDDMSTHTNKTTERASTAKASGDHSASYSESDTVGLSVAHGSNLSRKVNMVQISDSAQAAATVCSLALKQEPCHVQTSTNTVSLVSSGSNAISNKLPSTTDANRPNESSLTTDDNRPNESLLTSNTIKPNGSCLTTCTSRPNESSLSASAIRPNGSPLTTGAIRPNGSPLTTGAIRPNGSPLTTGAIRPNGSPLTTGAIRPNGSPLTTGVIRPNGSALTTGAIRPNGSPLTTGVIRPNGSPLTTGVIRPNGSALTAGVIRPNGSPLTTGVIRPNGSALTAGVIRPNGSPLTTGVIRPNGSALTAGVIRPNGSPLTIGTPLPPKQSYKLEEIHLRKFGFRPQESHKAEDDCVTLMKVAKISPGFMNWVNRNAVLLTTVPSPF